MKRDDAAQMSHLTMTSQAVPEPSAELLRLATGVRRAAIDLGQTTDQQRQQALAAMAAALERHCEQIAAANAADLEQAAADGLAPALVSRLKLDQGKLAGAIEGVRQVAALQDPLGSRQLHRELNEGLVLERITVPLGVLGVIFEARPDAVIQIASLAIRSGNGAILKGGSEANRTNRAVMEALKEGLADSVVSADALALLTTRQESLALLRLDGLVDLIIPRGSNELVRFIQDNTRIPVLGHADGVCHLLIDAEADCAQALRIAIDSKTQHPAACNAIETLLVHEAIAARFLADAVPAFAAMGVALRGDEASCALGVPHPATEADWSTEYLDLILSIRVVTDLEEAIDHISEFGSGHTESIVTDDPASADTFVAAIQSSTVVVNASTRFADGGELGLGAEIGISTSKLHAYGPMGARELTTRKFVVVGEGQVRG